MNAVSVDALIKVLRADEEDAAAVRSDLATALLQSGYPPDAREVAYADAVWILERLDAAIDQPSSRTSAPDLERDASVAPRTRPRATLGPVVHVTRSHDDEQVPTPPGTSRMTPVGPRSDAGRATGLGNSEDALA